MDDDSITDAQPPPPLPSDEELARLAPPLAAREEETRDTAALNEQLHVAIDGVLRGFSLRLRSWHVEYASNAACAT